MKVYALVDAAGLRLDLGGFYSTPELAADRFYSLSVADRDRVRVTSYLLDDGVEPFPVDLDRRCELCEYLATGEEECRINPPTPAGFPTVSPSRHWCGRFKRRIRG